MVQNSNLAYETFLNLFIKNFHAAFLLKYVTKCQYLKEFGRNYTLSLLIRMLVENDFPYLRNYVKYYKQLYFDDLSQSPSNKMAFTLSYKNTERQQ